MRDHVHDRLDLAFEDTWGAQSEEHRPTGRGICAEIRVPRCVAGSADALLSAKALPLPDRPSIAVLAFTNMSGDPEQEYFSDGIADDIITELSRIAWLFVIARNSSFTYKGSAIDVKQVGHELGVRYVLEGSVRRGGQRVRVDRTTHRRRDRQPRVGGTLRPRSGRCVRCAGRDHACGHQGYRTGCRRCRTAACAAQAARKPGGMGSLPTRPVASVAEEAGGSTARTFVLQPRARARSDAGSGPYRAGDIVSLEIGLFAKRPLAESLHLAADEARKAVELTRPTPRHLLTRPSPLALRGISPEASNTSSGRCRSTRIAFTHTG